MVVAKGVEDLEFEDIRLLKSLGGLMSEGEWLIALPRLDTDPDETDSPTGMVERSKSIC